MKITRAGNPGYFLLFGKNYINKDLGPEISWL